jgi:hypothetical protein
MYEISSKSQEEPDLVIAELLGVINRMANGNSRLEAIIREYQAIATSYAHKAAVLRDERDRARGLAARLEAECNDCWGPVHSQAVAAARLEAFLQSDEAAHNVT